MSLCVIFLNITKKEKLSQHPQIKLLYLQILYNRVNSELRKMVSAQQVIAKKEDKLKLKVPMLIIKFLRNQNKIPNKFR